VVLTLPLLQQRLRWLVRLALWAACPHPLQD
jgi:hypothetical protein